VLVDLQERSYEDAATIAGVSLDVLRTRLHRARQRLADLLAPGERP
jgi:RNA polymerase sigma-70 factor (ECF subfamily)